jgi:S-adenosylmethionine synthetase
MVATEVAIEIHIVDLSFLGELIINCLCHFFIVDLAISSIFLHPLDGLIELILEHLDSIERVSEHKLSKTRVELSQLVHVDSESVLSANDTSDFLLTFLVIQKVLHHLLHLELLSIGLHQTSNWVYLT